MNFKRKKPRRKVRCVICSYNRAWGNKENERSKRDRAAKEDSRDQLKGLLQ